VMDTNGNVALCDAHANIINEPPIWWQGLDRMTVMVGSDMVTLFVDVSDPEGQSMTYKWSHTCMGDNETVVFRTDLHSNKALLQFPLGSQPKICEVTVEVCDICSSCLVDKSDVRQVCSDAFLCLVDSHVCLMVQFSSTQDCPC
jgi:hypothetical protein